MKAVSFLSVAFMAASAVAAPFQDATRDVETSNKQVQRSAEKVVSGTVAQVARQAEGITDAASLISSLQGAQDSLSNPLSAIRMSSYPIPSLYYADTNSKYRGHHFSAPGW